MVDALDADRALAEGRMAFQAGRWSQAARLLTEASQHGPLSPEDVLARATACVIASPDQLGPGIWEEAHRELLDQGDAPRAARAGFWAAMTLGRLGEPARGSAWFERGRRLLEGAGVDCVEQGYMRILSVVAANRAGDIDTALALIAEISATARRFADADLAAFLRHAEGRAILRRGDVAAGLAILDETMLTITAGDVSVLMAGHLFCTLIGAFGSLHDVGRVREWTAAMQRWCDAQPEVDVFRGECRLHRARVLLVQGDWVGAADQTAEACRAFLVPPRHPAAGEALADQAELHRLAGRYAEAEAALAQAAESGHDPQPGMALLRMRQGKIDAARAGIRRALAETSDLPGRARFLPSAVEICLAAQDIEAAGEAAEELDRIAEGLGSEYLAGRAAQASGAVLLARGQPESALAELRQAASVWQHLDAAYHAAQTRVLIGRACRALGDEDVALVEIGGARRAFERLGAVPDAEDAAALLDQSAAPRPAGLTAREVELLGLLATGKSNREIAAALVISQKTVARHVSNIFTKLGVSSRAAATAFALRHGLA